MIGKLFVFTCSLFFSVSAIAATEGVVNNADTVNILGTCLPAGVINPVRSGDAPLTNVIDTLDTSHPGVKVLLFNDNTWRFYTAADSVSKASVFTKYWTEQSLNPYNLPLDSLPETWSVWLVDSLSSYHCPIDGNPVVSSNFGFRRGRRHQGIDISIPSNTPLYSMFDGKVRTATDKFSGYGNIVMIRHDNGLETFYAHMNQIDVKPGDVVKAGDKIGLSGNTGRSTGPHLHLEIRYDGYALDPQRVIDFKYGNLRQRIMVLKRRYFDANSVVTQDFDDEFRNQEDDAAELEAIKKKAAEEARKREAAAIKYHTVKSGDTLGGIARKYHTTTKAIVKLNKKSIPTESSIIRIGMKIRVK